jgi:hypothetical protein
MPDENDVQDEVTLDTAVGFDIESQVEQAKMENEGIVVHINGIDEKPQFFNKDGKLTPVTITVAGEHSDHYRRAEAAIRKRKLKPKSMTGQVVYDDNIEKIAACTLAWEGFFSRRRGSDTLVLVPMTPDNVKQVYNRCPWVLEQVLMAMTDHASFFGKESTKP